MAKEFWSIALKARFRPACTFYTFTVDGITMPDPVNPKI